MTKVDWSSAGCAGSDLDWSLPATETHLEYMLRTCRECPVLPACAELLADTIRDPATRPTGVWAGKVIGNGKMCLRHRTNRALCQECAASGGVMQRNNKEAVRAR